MTPASPQIGRYSAAIRVPADYGQIIVAGTPGLDENGNIPADFAEGARQAWRNVAAILEKAGTSISEIVSICQYLTREEDIETYGAVQKEMITHEPAAMLGCRWPERQMATWSRRQHKRGRGETFAAEERIPA